MNSFVNAFYYIDSSGRGFFKVDTNGTLPDKYHFWQTAEEIEMVEDAYERSHNATYKKMISQLVDGLNHLAAGQAPNPSDWCSWNGYNDDIMWACIALVRAYRDSGNYDYVTHAAAEFDEAWNRPYGADKVNGGFFWSAEPHSPGFPSKNSCVNCPACIAATLLSQAYKGPNDFLKRAQGIYDWEVANLFDTKTGAVYDNMGVDWNGNPIPARLNKGTLSYNQGTMIGASIALYNALRKSPDRQSYLKNAALAAAYTRDVYTPRQGHGEILPDESGNGDTVGMKGIFLRWCGQWAKQTRNKSFERWLQENANSAWKYRDTQGLTGSEWWHADPNAVKGSWECSGAVAACQDVNPN